ncbi:flagellar assembly lytic transglycosylase [Treponema putidum]|uniref:Lytic transglycosylase domain-containing protein n=1 Tax=Treponema putidum TaxID=221027 RepID=A0ABY5HUR0_9SPIR|nr:lytic transglycosylase domain-containing protein [Treponema putidum]
MLFFLFLCLCSVSCAGSYDKEEEARLIEDLYSENFYRFLRPQPLELKKLYNTDPSSLYYIGLAVKKASVGASDKKIYDESARAYFEYAVKNVPMPYKKLADDELYSLLSTEEKLKILEKKLALPEAIQLDNKLENQTIREEIQRLLFLSGNFKKMDMSLPEYLSTQKFDAEIIEGLKNLEKNKDELKSCGDDFFNVCQARKLVFDSAFKDAWEIFKPLIQEESNPNLEHRMVLSDLGKAALSGSEDYASDVLLFENRLDFYEKKSAKPSDYILQKYMYAFYAARMRLKMGGKDNVEKALLLFKKAKTYPPQPYDYDIALWYILDIEKNRSFKVFLEELCASAPSWKNSSVYEELAAHACMKLVILQDWKGLEKLQKAVQKTNLLTAQARLAYILAGSKSLPEEAKKLYLEVYEKNHNSFYYRAMAAYRLGVPMALSACKQNYKRKSNTEFSDEDSIKILEGFIKYKLYSQIYQKITLLYPQISAKEADFFAQVLSENGYYADSMRVMTFAVNSEGSQFNEEHLKLMYPRPWQESVKRYAAEYNLPEYLLYALLRSESYFKPEVVSHAGAIGLAQLMKPTAADIARRLKLETYDLNNPDTNIRFGAFYLSDMIRRNGGKIMHALFSYNAGPNAVKRWVRQAGGLPMDLFLESLAYAETRGYGRNILSAAIMYGCLYYGKDYGEIIKEFFPDIR